LTLGDVGEARARAAELELLVGEQQVFFFFITLKPRDE